MKRLAIIATAVLAPFIPGLLHAAPFTNEVGYAISARPTTALIGEQITVTWEMPLLGATHVGMFPVGGEIGDELDRVAILFSDNIATFTYSEEEVVEFWVYTDILFQLHAVSNPVFINNGVANLASIRNYPALGMSNIVFFGDSLFNGFQLEAGQDVVTRLSALTGLRLINASVDGDTTGEALLRLGTDVLVHDPRVVYIELGGNDFLTRRDFDEENDIPQFRTFENLRIIIHLVQESGAIAVLVGVQDRLTEDIVADNYKALAEETASLYVPNILEGIIGRFDMTILDLLHPNVAGVERMAERLLPSLQALGRREPLVLVVTAGEQPGTITFSWVSFTNAVYFIQQVSPPGLRIFPKYLATVSGTGGPVSVSLAVANEPMGFFRLREFSFPRTVFGP